MEVSNSLTPVFQNLRATPAPQQSVAEVSATEPTAARDVNAQDRATTEQQDVVNSLQTNARSLQAAGERVGTLIDVQA